MILAADLGSTNFKTAIFSADGRRLGQGSLPLPYEIHSNSVSELSPAVVARTFDAAILAALDSAGVGASEVECAAFTSQAQTFCVIDQEGAPSGPMIGWADDRGRSEAAELQAILGSELHGVTGWPGVSPGLLLSKSLWWKNHHQLRAGHKFATLPSFLALRLGAPLVLDRNLAAMTGLFSIPENVWWPAALQAVGWDAERFGKVVETGARVPLTHTPATPVLPNLRSVIFAGNDHTAGAVGCGCSDKRSVLTLGTAGVFYRFAGTQPGPYSVDGLWGPYPGGGFYEARFIAHACSALDWADNFLFGSVDSPRFVEAAKLAPAGSGGTKFFPERWGTDNAWNRRGRREEMARAVLEGITESLYDLASPFLKSIPPQSQHEILVLGGGSRLDFWVQMLADRLDSPLLRSKTDGLLGAARLAGADFSTASSELEQRFHPRNSH